MWKLVEKKNRLALHGLFDCKERAERHLRETIPDYCARGYFMDKTLRPDDFEILRDNDPSFHHKRGRTRAGNSIG